MAPTSFSGVLGFALAVMFAAGANTQDRRPDQPPAAKAVGGPQVDPFMDCARACDDCGRICEACGAHCTKLVAEGHKEHLKTVQTCQDCATLCKAASCIVARHGAFWDLSCTACAEACKRCGDACEAHAAHDPVMKQCMDECRRCEKACREMLKNASGNLTPPKR